MIFSSPYFTAGVLGAVFGFQGAVSPGPLQTLLISETLAHGVRSGWRGAFAPVCTDPFALAIALCFVTNVSSPVLAIIAFVGAALLFRIAWGEFKTKESDFDFEQKPRRSFFSIWSVNFLNPNLWIFSFTINAFQIGIYYKEFGLGVAATYIVMFFATIVLCNLGIVFLIGGLKRVFNAKWLVIVNRLLSLFLAVIALRFVYLGLTQLGIISVPPAEPEAVEQATTFLPMIVKWIEFAFQC